MNGLLYNTTKTKEDWFYSAKFNHAQRVNNQVYCYVSRLIYGYQVQLYLRGDVSYCSLEARTNDTSVQGVLKMFKMGEEWLAAYGDGNVKEINKDDFCVSNPDGVWFDDGKKYWV